MRRLLALACALLLPVAGHAELTLEKGGTILFYGGGMVERLLEQGDLEAYLQLANADRDLHVRSLAWTGDEVGWRARPEGYVEHLRVLLAKWPASVVVLGYGMNESFAGAAGLADFRVQLEGCLRETERLHPGAQLVLLSPTAVEKGGPADSLTRNRELAEYVAAMRSAAGLHHAQFVDLFTASQSAYAVHAEPLTTLGLHLNELGCQEMAKVIARALLGAEAVDRIDPVRLAEVAQAAGRKSRYVADVVRPKNGVVYYGVRKRPEENAAEIPRYFQLIDQADATLHELLRNPGTRFSDCPPPSLPPMPEGKSNPDRFGGGVIKAPAEQQKEFKVAEGYALNLFASEEQFPELRNPVQMAFDARGRLWVVTMPSFPHTPPGAQPDDKILILEDTDHDGRADKCTVFAGGFDALDGIAFHERGVIVSAQPRLLLLTDRDGDDHADTQTELLRGIDVTDSHHGGMVEVDPLGHVIFCDGVFHRSQIETPFGVVRGIDSTTYRLDPANGQVEREYQTMTPNPWKVAFDRYGNLFQHYGGGHVTESLPLTWTPLGAYHPYATGTVLDYNKGCALDIISSPNFPAEYQQGVAQGTLLGSYFVSISKVNADAGPLVGTDRLDVISSPNAAFRPVDIEFGFDGAMYVADFCSRIIGHAQHPMRDPQWNHEHGRIWRVVRKDAPLVRDWPRIERATASELFQLLLHPQNLIRAHARLRLRGWSGEIVPALDAWIASLDRSSPVFDQAALEVLWILQAKGEVRPALLGELLKSRDALMRVAAVQLIRFQEAQLPDPGRLLATMARDPHPRVRMAVISVVARCRAAHPALEAALAELRQTPSFEPAVAQMLNDLRFGQKPMKGRSVPVLEVAPATELHQWAFVGETGVKDQAAYATQNDHLQQKSAPPKTRTWRTYVQSEAAQTALLSVKHGYLDISVDGVQLLSADSPYSSEQQLEIELQAGLNEVTIAFRRLKENMPQVHLSDMVGQPLDHAHLAHDEAALKSMAGTWAAAHPGEANVLRVQAVPNQMIFAPAELRVKAGQPVTIVFENPDLMLHNFVLLSPGATEEVGALADHMATEADALLKNYLPVSSKILHSTPLVKPNERHELKFTAPTEPGRYPYICTFPGHWRVMRGLLIVEPADEPSP